MSTLYNYKCPYCEDVLQLPLGKFTPCKCGMVYRAAFEAGKPLTCNIIESTYEQIFANDATTIKGVTVLGGLA